MSTNSEYSFDREDGTPYTTNTLPPTTGRGCLYSYCRSKARAGSGEREADNKLQRDERLTERKRKRKRKNKHKGKEKKKKEKAKLPASQDGAV